MPFAEGFLPVYESIKNTLSELGMSSKRSDEIYSSAPILTDILTGIAKANLIVADLSGRNPNVLYELGIAHMHKDNARVILLANNKDDIPFDIAHLRVILYEPTEQGYLLLRDALKRTVQQFQSGPTLYRWPETAPVPSSPLNNSQLPGLSVVLSWTNPPGTQQVHVQVHPLNDEGPSINEVLAGDHNIIDIAAPVFGKGPYVMLPGATYIWRVRASLLRDPLDPNSPQWGPWSPERSFTTARPNSGTIQMIEPINLKVTGREPLLMWKDANPAMFLYEIQVLQKAAPSGDPKAPVDGLLVHTVVDGSLTTPPNSFRVPASVPLAPGGKYHWRIRQRVQGTPSGGQEPGVSWTESQSFLIMEYRSQ